ncbi:MAG: uncharacterized protein PWP07_1907 [Epulopiscium sp.]|uniref:DUF116 domain-containing protein n=1 Tax=Defluviitalea raffinosedens TaxID=1450156 RepID=A0A7C8LRQ3_9FIRM|nr:DUF116 domain-containing protein [Defluviitalea raffinosedens]KAE9637205.1 DUF116 domain-containing protein [Defluviitalea raffinosedens]MBM7685504.1 hypothetical protein [Defluviitalea raffinosedens]MBZ4669235.1 hypothetical protein [Defluviitaleaceae bacterium]MDK2788662.1 uncharacterized protein [Candidatus Epulonipiscium sp.]
MDIWVKQFTKILVATTIFFLGICIILLTAYKLIPIYFYKLLFSLLTLFFLIIGIIFISASIFLIAVYKRGKVFIFSPQMLLSTLRWMYPLALAIVNFFHANKSIVNQFFIYMNNICVDSMKLRGTSEDILILIPHCVQNSQCGIKITSNLLACKECNQCKIVDLKHLKEQFNCKIAIATGGTLARKAVVETHPKYVIAVACERDLVNGILDVNTIPIYGILNQLPNGPCFNTTINVQEIEDVIIRYIDVNNKE